MSHHKQPPRQRCCICPSKTLQIVDNKKQNTHKRPLFVRSESFPNGPHLTRVCGVYGVCIVCIVCSVCGVCVTCASRVACMYCVCSMCVCVCCVCIVCGLCVECVQCVCIVCVLGVCCVVLLRRPMLGFGSVVRMLSVKVPVFGCAAFSAWPSVWPAAQAAPWS